MTAKLVERPIILGLTPETLRAGVVRVLDQDRMYLDMETDRKMFEDKLISQSEWIQQAEKAYSYILCDYGYQVRLSNNSLICLQIKVFVHTNFHKDATGVIQTFIGTNPLIGSFADRSYFTKTNSLIEEPHGMKAYIYGK